MEQHTKTRVAPMRIKQRNMTMQHTIPRETEIAWQEVPASQRGSNLMKNLAVASALILCAVTLRTGAIPPLDKTADAVMTAATDNSLLDDQLGKLSFVSALFPEAVLVFGESEDDRLTLPVSGGTVVHTWSEAEPYMSWVTGNADVLAAAAGEVIGVYHGNGDERLVQVLGDDGLACLYGNLADIAVQVGDAVQTGDVIGRTMKGESLVFEVRRDGMSIAPDVFFER